MVNSGSIASSEGPPATTSSLTSWNGLWKRVPVGRLYDLCRCASEHLESAHIGDQIGLVRAKGQLATKTGFLVSLVSPSDADDPDKIRRLCAAADELGIHIAQKA